MGLLTTAFADIQCPDLYLEQVDLAVVDIKRADHWHHIVHAAKSQVFTLNTTCATGTFYNGDDIAGRGCINHILQDICGLYKPGRPVGKGGSEGQAEEKGKNGIFHDQNLLHGGSGGFNGDGASDGYGEGIGGEADRDGAIGGGSIGQIIPSPA